MKFTLHVKLRAFAYLTVLPTANQIPSVTVHKSYYSSRHHIILLLHAITHCHDPNCIRCKDSTWVGVRRYIVARNKLSAFLIIVLSPATVARNQRLDEITKDVTLLRESFDEFWVLCFARLSNYTAATPNKCPKARFPLAELTGCGPCWRRVMVEVVGLQSAINHRYKKRSD